MKGVCFSYLLDSLAKKIFNSRACRSISFAPRKLLTFEKTSVSRAFAFLKLIGSALLLFSAPDLLHCTSTVIKYFSIGSLPYYLYKIERTKWGVKYILSIKPIHYLTLSNTTKLNKNRIARRERERERAEKEQTPV